MKESKWQGFENESISYHTSLFSSSSTEKRSSPACNVQREMVEL